MRDYMMNATEFAAMLNVKKSTYSQWENELSNPSIEKGFEIAHILKKKFEEIWFYE
jgi:DNA-binding XRE family transcriptional regulator